MIKSEGGIHPDLLRDNGQENRDLLLIAGRLTLFISMVRIVSNNQLDSWTIIEVVAIHKVRIYAWH